MNNFLNPTKISIGMGLTLLIFAPMLQAQTRGPVNLHRQFTFSKARDTTTSDGNVYTSGEAQNFIGTSVVKVNGKTFTQRTSEDGNMFANREILIFGKNPHMSEVDDKGRVTARYNFNSIPTGDDKVYKYQILFSKAQQQEMVKALNAESVDYTYSMMVTLDYHTDTISFSFAIDADLIVKDTDQVARNLAGDQ